MRFSLPGLLLIVRKGFKLPREQFLLQNPGWESRAAGGKGHVGRLAPPLIPQDGLVRGGAGGHRLQGKKKKNPSGWSIFCQELPHFPEQQPALLGNIFGCFSLFFGPLLTRAFSWKRGAVLAPITYPRLLMGRVLMDDLKMFDCSWKGKIICLTF